MIIKDSYSFPKNPGIYKFTNIENGKIYIGESMYLKDRMSKYRSSAKKPVCPIELALAKYSFEGFLLEVIELFPIETLKPVLLEREKFWIKFYDSTKSHIGYNISPCGTDMTGKKMSEAAKSKISAANKGRKFSDESRARMSAGQKGKKVSNSHCIGKKLSEEHKKKVGAALLGKAHPSQWRKINQIDENGNIVYVWPSLTAAASSELFDNKRLGFSLISRVLRGVKKTTRGFKWEHAEPPRLPHHSKL